jgi:uracil phosphoribosyltransferase
MTLNELVTEIKHPLVQHKLSLMRSKDTPTDNFRRLLREISQMLAYEVTRDLPIEFTRIETPIQVIDAPTISGKKLCVISVLRAGNGILDGMLDLLPNARRSYRPVPRPGNTGTGRVLLQSAGRYR